MKEHTQIVDEIIFSRLPTSYSLNSWRSLCISRLKKWADSCESHLQNGVATLTIGSVMLLGVYLFLSRLAEYGW